MQKIHQRILNRQVLTTTAITFAILLGCSSATKTTLPPMTEMMPPDMASWPINDQFMGDKDFKSIDLFLNGVAKENPAMNTTWWVDYRRAQLWSKKDKNVACENFSRLANELKFPLRRLAYLRAHTVCPHDNQILARLEPFRLEQFTEPWLAAMALDVAIQNAKGKNDRALLVDLNLRKSKMNLRKEEKLAFAEEALLQAHKLGDKNKVRELESRIYNLAPSKRPDPPQNEWLAVASDYRYFRAFDKALAYYQKVIDSPKTNANEKILALRGVRTTYKIQQKKEETIVATAKLADFIEKYYKKSRKSANDARLYTDTQLILAKTYWTENRGKDAIRVLNMIEKQVGNKASLAELYWMRGRMEEEKQNFNGAIDWFKKALAESIDTAAFRDKISTYLAWNEYKRGHYAEATTLYRDLVKRADGNLEKTRLQFWLAKSLAAGGEKSDAEDEYRDLIKEDPLSFYGLVAHREIGESLPTKTVRRAKAERDADMKKMPRPLREVLNQSYLEWLIATREEGIARDYLDGVSAELKKQTADDIESWTSLFYLYARSQNYMGLFAQLNQLPTPLRRQILEEKPHIIFPNPYFETVSQAAGRFGISVEFIYSIMRQESSFNPLARSHMDAFGLMQLLPQVAKRSAEANAIEFNGADDLYEPYVNIPLGSAHLRELWDKYNGELVLAVASYNASEQAILTWLKTRFRGDTLEFIEDIPYDETRDYVKLVLRNLIAYQILNASADTLIFPEWTLKISYQPLGKITPDSK